MTSASFSLLSRIYSLIGFGLAMTVVAIWWSCRGTRTIWSRLSSASETSVEALHVRASDIPMDLPG